MHENPLETASKRRTLGNDTEANAGITSVMLVMVTLVMAYALYPIVQDGRDEAMENGEDSNNTSKAEKNMMKNSGIWYWLTVMALCVVEVIGAFLALGRGRRSFR